MCINLIQVHFFVDVQWSAHKKNTTFGELCLMLEQGLKHWKSKALTSKGSKPQLSPKANPQQRQPAGKAKNLFGLSIEHSPQQTVRFVSNVCQWIEKDLCMSSTTPTLTLSRQGTRKRNLSSFRITHCHTEVERHS